MKRSTNKREIEQRYFQALKSIYNSLKYTDKLNMAAIIKDYNLSKSVYEPLKSGGILKTNGIKARGCRYYWIGKEPSLEMAIELIRQLNETDKRPNARKFVKTSKSNPAKSTSNTIVKKSFLWGLYVSETITTS